MGGVAGHAGLFSTADDLSKFCQALLDGKLLSPLTIEKMSTPQQPPAATDVRSFLTYCGRREERCVRRTSSPTSSAGTPAPIGSTAAAGR